MDLILLHGAPGTGKTTTAQLLHRQLGSPWFEFGWIPEFRKIGEAEIPYEVEEALSFENLTLVVKNYLRHGFQNIIITDLRDPYIQKALRVFARRRFLLVTLVCRDEAVLKARVLDENRPSGFRDWETALDLNRVYQLRKPHPRELRLDVAQLLPEDVVSAILKEAGLV